MFSKKIIPEHLKGPRIESIDSIVLLAQAGRSISTDDVKYNFNTQEHEYGTSILAAAVYQHMSAWTLSRMIKRGLFLYNKNSINGL